jgi:hypothetical protein
VPDVAAATSLGVVREERRLQLCRSDFGRVRLEDAGLGLHDLSERPKGDPFAVRQAASLPPADELRLRVDIAEELGYEPALAHTRLADDRHQLHRPLLRRALEDPDQQRLLELAAHERGPVVMEAVAPEAVADRVRPPER